MITIYRYDKASKAPGPYYTFTYDNGNRAVRAEFQGDLRELEEMGRQLSRERQREVRMRVHVGKRDRIHAIFNYSRQRNQLLKPFRTSIKGENRICLIS